MDPGATAIPRSSARRVLTRLRGGVVPPAREWVRTVPGGFLFFFVGNGLIAVAEQSIASSVAAVVAASTGFSAMRLQRWR